MNKTATLDTSYMIEDFGLPHEVTAYELCDCLSYNGHPCIITEEASNE